ncbi:hypothetical protein BY996DRAFT_6572069 [Phakopsora pachyrhizi]|nr:hypothetical protein BY996DRAFT_6572069 [Phakopsora pachyrhizi]
MPEEGSTREPIERAAALKPEGWCRYRRANDVKRCAISQGRRRKGLCGLYGPMKARMRFGGIKFAGGRPEEVSVGLVRRRETPRRLKDQRRTDIGGISRTVVGRAVGQDCWAGRARRRHTEVRSSYHFRDVLTNENQPTEACGIL